MREHIRRIRPKDPLSSRHQNQIVDRVNELSNPRTTQTIALFEVTTELQFPGRDAVPGSIYMPPFCSGKRISYSFYEQKIGTQYTALTELLYFPQAERDATTGIYDGDTSQIETSEWYWCVWNTETGRWEIVYAQGGGAAQHVWFELIESLIPGGSAAAHKLTYNTDTSKWEKTRTLLDGIQTAAGGDDATKWIFCKSEPFASGAVGHTVDILGPATSGWVVGEKTVTEFYSPSRSDLVIGGDGESVSSEAAPFSGREVGLTLTVTGGDGFTPGDYEIESVDGEGVASLDGAVGTPASTGGTATQTPMVKLDAAAAASAATSGGSAIETSQIVVYDEPMGCRRCVGEEDLPSECNTLHLEDEILIVNEDQDGITLVEGDVVTLPGGEDGVTAGTYFLLYDETLERIVLDRPACAAEADISDVKGYVIRAAGCRGVALYDSAAEKHWIVHVREQSLICEARTVGPVYTPDNSCKVIELIAKDRGVAPQVNELIGVHTSLEVVDLTTVFGVKCDSFPFNENDVNMAIEISSLENVYDGVYLIIEYDSETGAVLLDRDFVIDPDDESTPWSGGEAGVSKPVQVYSNGWSGPDGHDVTLLWDEEQERYEIVREYLKLPIVGGYYGFVASVVDTDPGGIQGMVGWVRFDDDMSCYSPPPEE